MYSIGKPDIWNPNENSGVDRVSANKKIGTSYWLVERRKDAGAVERLGAEMTRFGPFADLLLAIKAAKKRIERTGHGVEVQVENGVDKAKLS